MHALRGSDYQTQAELHDIQSVCNSTSTGGFISTIMNMKCKEVWIPVSMMLAMFILQVCFLSKISIIVYLIYLFLFQPMSGSDILVFYSLDIFKRANVNMNSHVLAIFVQSGFLSGYIIAAFLMSRVTRKTQFIISGFFMATFLFALGFILKSNTEVSLQGFCIIILRLQNILRGHFDQESCVKFLKSVPNFNYNLFCVLEYRK